MTEDKISLYQEIQSQGSFRKGHFDDLVKMHLRRSKEQHKALIQNIVSKDLFERYANIRIIMILITSEMSLPVRGSCMPAPSPWFSLGLGLQTWQGL